MTKQVSLLDDPIIVNHFELQEINQLQELLYHFDSQVIAIIGGNYPVAQAYDEFTGKMAHQAESHPYYLLELLSEYFKQESLNIQNNPVFGHIWNLREANDTVDMYLDFNVIGKYEKFLTELGNYNSLIREYHESVVATGTITPSAFINVLLYSSRLNTRLERDRLFLVIHYITIINQQISER